MRKDPLKRMPQLLVVTAFVVMLCACEGTELTIIPLPNPTEVSTITATVPITRVFSIQASEPLKTELSPDEYQILRVLLSQKFVHDLTHFTVTELHREEVDESNIMFGLGTIGGLIVDNELILKETYLSPLDVYAATAREQQTFLLDLVRRWLSQNLEPDIVFTELSSIDPGATLAAYEDYLKDNSYLPDVFFEAIMMRLYVEIFGPQGYPIPGL